MDKSDKIYICGSNGMVGSAFVRALLGGGYNHIITASHNELDLTDKPAVTNFFKERAPDVVILAAAKVGGIKANMTYPVEFLQTNLEIQNNIIPACNDYNVKQLVFLGSSCIYPAKCLQPMKEEYLMAGKLEPTNEAYAVAKIAGIKLAQYYHKQYGMNVCIPQPCNLYGQNDSFDPYNSHVLSALVRKFVDAAETKEPTVTMWGTGTVRREFLHVDDAVRAILLLMDKWNSPEIINIGSGEDVSIKELAGFVANAAHYKGEIKWDTKQPDGMMRKCLDITKLKKLGFKPKIYLQDGIRDMIKEYKKYKSVYL